MNKEKSTSHIMTDRIEWWVENKYIHREDGPAVIFTRGVQKGTVFWYRFGSKHRLDGPAVEYADGSKEWWVDNKRHRLDGPAVEWADGSKAWFVNGKRHRLDGPAIEWADGSKEWCVDDTCYTTFQSYLEDVKPLITEQEYFILVLTYGTEK